MCLYKLVPTSSKKLSKTSRPSLKFLPLSNLFISTDQVKYFYIFIKNRIPTTLQFLKALLYSVLLCISYFYGHATVIMNCLPLCTLSYLILVFFFLSYCPQNTMFFKQEQYVVCGGGVMCIYLQYRYFPLFFLLI